MAVDGERQDAIGRPKDLAELIRSRRLARRLTSRRLAALAGCDCSVVVRAEQGRLPTPRTLARLAGPLGLELAELYALAGYLVSWELPGLRPYVQLKYKELPGAAVDELESFLGYLQVKYRAEPSGPSRGEDEEPDGA